MSLPEWVQGELERGKTSASSHDKGSRTSCKSLDRIELTKTSKQKQNKKYTSNNGNNLYIFTCAGDGLHGGQRRLCGVRWGGCCDVGEEFELPRTKRSTLSLRERLGEGTHIHTHINTYTHTYTHKHTYTQTHTHIHTRTNNTYNHIQPRTRTNITTRAHRHTHTYTSCWLCA